MHAAGTSLAVHAQATKGSPAWHLLRALHIWDGTLAFAGTTSEVQLSVLA
jgi:hypothetical protein